MVRIALPNKGSLAEEAVYLLSEAGYRCKRHHRELIVRDKDYGIEFVFLRPRDIAVYVSRGVLELGITGRDLAYEARDDLNEVLSLGFGKSRFCYAVPKGSQLTVDQFKGLRVATSYPDIVNADLQKRGVQADIVELDGAVEVSVELGVADVIADVVQSGRTLVEAGLEIIGEPIMESEAIVVARVDGEYDSAIEVCINRLRGIVVARDFMMVEYDAPEALLEQCCALTPGIESPTVSPLTKQGWVAVKAMVKYKQVNQIMDKLEHLGAKGIIVTNIRTCRL